jgi:chromate transporter
MSSSVSLVQIVLVVLLGNLFSLGGGNGPIAIVQSQWVGGGQLAPSQFAWILALSYISPGPKAGFLSGVGYTLQGLPGAAAAILATVIPTCVAAAGVTHLFSRLRPVITRISLPGGFVIAGMIAAAAWGTAEPMNLHGTELLAVAAVAVLVGWRNVDSLWIVLGAAVVGLLGWFR